jgi:hypothetical protein
MRLSVDQFRDGLIKTFAAEGLPLIEFQNVPLPGHALFQGRVGYGKGCPWTCQGRSDLRYRVDDYPGALQAIRESLVVGLPSRAPLANAEIVDKYILCFEKLRRNLGEFESFARMLPSNPPWRAAPRLF